MDLILVADCLHSAQPLLKVASKAGYRMMKAIEPGVRVSSHVESLRPDALIFVSDEIDGVLLREMAAVSKKRPTPIIVFTRDSQDVSIDAAVKAGATVYVIDCNAPERLVSLLGVAKARFQEQQRLQKELRQTKSALSERTIKADYLKPVVEKYKDEGKSFKMGMVFPVSTHNYELRYWLAAGGLHPGYYAQLTGDTAGTIDADVLLSVTPPPQMPSTMEAGTIHGYCVGEPWNQQAVFKGIGVPVITDYEIWKDNPEKVFGVSKAWAEKYPNTHKAVVKALIRAAMWLDEGGLANRKEASKILSRSEYVGADYEVIANSMTGTFEYEKGDTRSLPDFNVFFRNKATYPYYSDAVWYLSQMRRWGQIAEYKSDDW